MDAKTERLIAAIRAWATLRPEACGTTQVIDTPGMPDGYVPPSAALTPPAPTVGDVDGPVVGVLVGDDNLTDRERALVDRHDQFRDLLARYALLWRETARSVRAKGGQVNIAAGVAYDMAACDIEDALTADAKDGADHG